MSRNPRVSDCSRRSAVEAESARVAKAAVMERCGVCAQAGDDLSPLLACQSCGAAVHAECFFCDITAAARSPFTCHACARKRESGCSPACALCNAKGGLLLRSTAPGQWVHGVCATFVRGVSLRPDADGSHFIADGVSSVLSSPPPAARSPARLTPLAVVAPKTGGGDSTGGGGGGGGSDSRPLSRAIAPGIESPASPWIGCVKNTDCVREFKHRGTCKVVPDLPSGAVRRRGRPSNSARREALASSGEPGCAGGRGCSAPGEPGNSEPVNAGPVNTGLEKAGAVNTGPVKAEPVVMGSVDAGGCGSGGTANGTEHRAVERSPASLSASERKDLSGGASKLDAQAPASLPPINGASAEATCEGCGGGSGGSGGSGGIGLSRISEAGYEDRQEGDGGGREARVLLFGAAGCESGCEVCGGGSPSGGGYAQCAAEGCTALLHPHCCLQAGLVLGSVPHFGADLHFVLCVRHSVGGGAAYAPASVLGAGAAADEGGRVCAGGRGVQGLGSYGAAVHASVVGAGGHKWAESSDGGLGSFACAPPSVMGASADINEGGGVSVCGGGGQGLGNGLVAPFAGHGTLNGAPFSAQGVAAASASGAPLATHPEGACERGSNKLVLMAQGSAELSNGGGGSQDTDANEAPLAITYLSETCKRGSNGLELMAQGSVGFPSGGGGGEGSQDTAGGGSRSTAGRRSQDVERTCERGRNPSVLMAQGSVHLSSGGSGDGGGRQDTAGGGLHNTAGEAQAVDQALQLPQGIGVHLSGDGEGGGWHNTGEGGPPDASLAISLRRCYVDDSHLEYKYSHESRATKLSRLLAPNAAAAPPPPPEPPTARNTHPGHMPPLGRAYHYEFGCERTGADGREWRVVADEKKRHRWAALDAGGRPTGLVAGAAKLPKGNTGGGRGDAGFRKGVFGAAGGARGRRLGAGLEGEDPALIGVPWPGVKEGCAELSIAGVDAKLWPGAAAEGWRVCEAYRGGSKSSNYRYVAPWGFYFSSRAVSMAAKEHRRKIEEEEESTEILEYDSETVDAKLWPGAFARGWRIREAYLNARKYGNWKYMAPWGAVFKTKVAAIEAHEMDLAGQAPDGGGVNGGGYPKVTLVMSRGGAPNPDGSDRRAAPRGVNGSAAVNEAAAVNGAVKGSDVLKGSTALVVANEGAVAVRTSGVAVKTAQGGEEGGHGEAEYGGGGREDAQVDEDDFERLPRKRSRVR